MTRLRACLHRISSTLWIILLWAVREYSSYYGNGLVGILPAPSLIFQELYKWNMQIGIWSQSSSIRLSIAYTLFRVLWWLSIALVLSIIIWSYITTSYRLRKLITPILQLFAPIAPIAWISIALAMFGIGNFTAIFIVFMWVFFILTLNTIKAIDGVPVRLLQISKNLGNSDFQTRYRVIIPYITPYLFMMVRMNLMAAWMAVLAAEMTWLRDGLWAIIMIGRNLFNYNLIVFWMILIAICWIISDNLLLYIQKKYFWR